MTRMGNKLLVRFKNITQRRHLEPAFWVRDLLNVDRKLDKSNIYVYDYFELTLS